MLPSQALLLLCHLDNDIGNHYIYTVVLHMTYINLKTWGHFFSQVPQCGPAPGPVARNKERGE